MYLDDIPTKKQNLGKKLQIGKKVSFLQISLIFLTNEVQQAV